MIRDPKGYNPDHPQAIPIGKYCRPWPPPERQLPLSWKEATRLFFRDNRKRVITRFAVRYLPALLGFIGIGEDVAIPVLGLTEEPLTIGSILWCVWRINKYRKSGK